MEKDLEEKETYPFRPTVEGCVARDPRLAAAFAESYSEELRGVVAYSYLSILFAQQDARASALFGRLAKEEMQHFRMLGELILALGGNPSVQARIGTPAVHPCKRGRAGIITDAIRDERCGIDRYQTLMGRTQDRVVRALLSHLIADEHRHTDALCREQEGGF